MELAPPHPTEPFNEPRGPGVRGRTDTGSTETASVWFAAFWKMGFIEDESAKMSSGMIHGQNDEAARNWEEFQNQPAREIQWFAAYMLT
jgi:hypothetical protein